MAYYDKVYYEVWTKDDSDTEWTLDTSSYDREELVTYCNRTIAEIENNPHWGYRGFVMKIVEVENPNYDHQRVMDDEKWDYYYHRDL